MRSFTVEKTVPISLVLLRGQSLSAFHYELGFTILTNATSTSDKDIEDAHLYQNINFSKILVFIEGALHQSVVFDQSAADFIFGAFAQLDNNLMVLPQVTEEVMLAAIHCKLNSIVSHGTYIDKVSLRNIDTDLTYQYILYDNEPYLELPSKSEWLTKLSYWPDCWWNRPDTNTMDRNAADQQELDEWQELKETHNLDELYMAPFNEVESQYIDAVSKKDGEVIDVDFSSENSKKWSPVVVK